MTARRRLALVISSLGPGGAERVLSTMANYWSAQGVDVTLLTLVASDSDFYPLDSRVARVGLNVAGASTGPLSAIAQNVGRVLALRHALLAAKPDAVISFGDRTNLSVALSLLGTRVPLVVAERSDPRHQQLGILLESLRRLLYRNTVLVVQTESVRKWAVEILRCAALHVIPNPVSSDSGSGTATPRAAWVVSVGRLTPEKGHDLLLRAFAAIPSRDPLWRLCIAGDGPQRAALLTLADELTIAGAVDFLGTKKPIENLLRQAGIFVLPSRYEGFPNALLEAMANGAPVIAFDCPSGPAEIVTHGVDGLLVRAGDVAALASAIGSLMADAQRREKLGVAARAIARRFALDAVMQRWDEVLAASSSRRGAA